jgi:CheY-like chemotaxis protein/HPt (histidine-containing phosphotransfer) domain-containing protein
MNAALGMIDLAAQKTDDPVIADFLQTAKEAADGLLTLLNDLLDSAKIEAGKLELESAPFSLRRVVEQTRRVLGVRAGEKGLRFLCRVSDDVPDVLVGDPVRLRQILFNLAGNAIKFTEKGEVEIRVRALPSAPEEACLEFSVRDTGIGISECQRQRIFQPFAQAAPSTTRRYGGTGLGLSICARLVALMSGRIRVDSMPGQGSTFCFTVRMSVDQDPLAETPRAPLAAAPPALVNILLVEDNPANQKLVSCILRERGHRVEIAGDGYRALRLTQENRYDVILMDVQMPGMSGLETTAAIRAGQSGSSRVPIIAMTAHAFNSDRECCLEAGMDEYLAKPVNAEAMIALVESLAHDASREAQIAGPAQGSPQATAVVFNPEEALARCYHRRPVLEGMIRCFPDEMDTLLPQMRAALERGDLVEVGRLGHRMKGTVVYLGAERAEQAALRVERFCKSSGGAFSEAEAAVRALEGECLLLKAALAEHPLATEPSSGAE